MRNSKTKTLVVSAMFAAIIFCGTFFIKIPLPLSTEYVHVGDGFIYLAAAIIPVPYAAAAAAVGAALADLAGGDAVWGPWTIVIKALMALFVGLLCKGEKISAVRFVLAMVIATVINVFGYYFGGVVIYQSWITGLAALPFTLIQSLVAIVVFKASERLVKRLAKQ
jgi:uncharacterized repeat protein (TIGR04002 family)